VNKNLSTIAAQENRTVIDNFYYTDDWNDMLFPSPEVSALQENHTPSQKAEVKDLQITSQFSDAAIPAEYFKSTVEYYQTQTDAPKEFLFSSALMTASSVIGNRVKIQLGSQEISTNLYMVLLAGSTVSRKSTAISLTTKKLAALEKQLNTPFLMPNSGSLEGMIEAMRDAREDETKSVMNSGVACYSEFSSFLDNMRKNYNEGYESFMLDVYDGNQFKRQLKNKYSEINNPCLSIFGAITMSQFSKKIKEDDKHSGLLQRFLFCYEPEKKTQIRSLVQIAAPDQHKEAIIMQGLTNIYKTSLAIQQSGKQFTLSQDAVKEYQKSFEADQTMMESVKKSNGELAEMLYGYQGRIDVMKIKIAMIFETVKMATTGNFDVAIKELIITEESMKQALAAVAYYWNTVTSLLSNEFKFSPYAQKLKKLEDMLRKSGGCMSKRLLQKNSNWFAKEFNAVLETAIASGILQVVEEKSASGQTTVSVQLL